MTPVEMKSKVVSWALAEAARGVREDRGDNRDSLGRIKIYGKWSGQGFRDGFPYCAANWETGWRSDEGANFPALPPSAYSPYLVGVAMSGGTAECPMRFIPAVTGLEGEPADGVVFDTPNRGRYNHWETHIRYEPGIIVTVGANTLPDHEDRGTTNNPIGGVYVRRRKLPVSKLVGFVRIFPANAPPRLPLPPEPTGANAYVMMARMEKRPGSVLGMQKALALKGLYEGALDDDFGPLMELAMIRDWEAWTRGRIRS